jgi:hypothetical protein
MRKQMTAALIFTTLTGPVSAAWYDCRVVDNQAADLRDNTLVDLPVEAQRSTRAFMAQDASNPTDIGLDCRLNEEE